MPSMTRGPLSSSVYWRRRLVLLTVAVILVVAIAKLLDHGSDGSSSPGPGAQGVAAFTGVSPSTSVSPTRLRTRHTPSPSVPTSTAPAVPSGPCQGSDVLVTPRVDEAVVGEPVSISLDIRTVSEPACYWRLSPHTAQVRISRGGSTVWSTVGCGMAVPRQQIVAREDETTSVSLTWAGHRTDSVCSSHDPWAAPGRYWIEAAALGGEPATSTFELLKTAPSTTAAPSATATPSSTATPSATASPSSTATPSRTPTGRARHAGGASPTRTAD